MYMDTSRCRKAIFFLFLVFLWPAGNFITINSFHGIHWIDFYIVLFLLFTLSILVSFFIHKLIKLSFSEAIFFVGIIVLIACSYFPITDILFNLHLFTFPLAINIIWIIFFITTISISYIFISRSILMEIFIIVTFFMSCSSLLLSLININYIKELKLNYTNAFPINTSSKKDLPNIYWIGLDSYTSNSAFQYFLHYDNSPFEAFLHRKGFYIAKDAQSNYLKTVLSLSSTIKMDYINGYEGREIVSKVEMPSNFDILLSNGYGFATWARDQGYSILQIDGLIRCSAVVDECFYGSQDHYSSLLQFYFFQTPLLRFMWKFFPRFSPIKTGVEDFIHALPPSLERPFFLFGHAHAMHVPNSMDAHCNPSFLNVEYEWDGKDIKNREKVVFQLECINRILIKLVDKLISNDPDSLIIINGDHGIRPINVFPSVRNTESLHLYFDILNAFRLPSNCHSLLYDNISPVNNFRIVKTCIEKNVNKSALIKDRIILTNPGSAKPNTVVSHPIY